MPGSKQDPERWPHPHLAVASRVHMLLFLAIAGFLAAWLIATEELEVGFLFYLVLLPVSGALLYVAACVWRHREDDLAHVTWVLSCYYLAVHQSFPPDIGSLFVFVPLFPFCFGPMLYDMEVGGRRGLLAGSIVTFLYGVYLLVRSAHGFVEIIVYALFVLISIGAIYLSILDFRRPPRRLLAIDTDAAEDPSTED